MDGGAKGLTNFEIMKLVRHLNIPNFRGVFPRDGLPDRPNEKECGVVNFNESSEPGLHWVAYYENGQERNYFDSFGCVIPIEIRKYL